jgi:NAD(P)-dependent dehydrogenase (short-subunit alcohol dehydrogenase family)
MAEGPLSGKIALVTGASRGIGRATALRLASEGATLAVHYKSNADAAQATVDSILSAGGGAFAIAADLADRSAPQRLFRELDAELLRRFGSTGFDILVNNAGVGVRGTIEGVSEDTFDRILQVDFKAPFFIIQQALGRLRDGGRIINVSSTAARIAYPWSPVYGPAKAALETLTVSLAKHLGPRGITVNAVTPGTTATDMNAVARDPVASRPFVELTALGRVGQPEDIADVIAFLATDRARWITGQRIDTSGGLRL